MKKILFILFAITTIICGQARYTLPDSIVAHRAELNAHADSIDGLRTSINNQDDSLAIHLDTLQAIRVDINNVDSLTAIRTDVNINVDSLEAIRTDVNINVDSLEAIRTDVNAITVGTTGYLLLTGDNTISGDNEFTGESDFTTGEVLIGEKPSVPVANQLTASVDQAESGLWWGASLRMPDIDAVQGLLDLNYTYDLPEVITNGDDTLNFTNDRNFVKSVMTVAADNNLNLYFANSGYGNITILIIGGWNPSGTINWNTTIVGETLKWVSGTEPPLDTSTSDQVFMISFMKVTSALIIGQWNWAE